MVINVIRAVMPVLITTLGPPSSAVDYAERAPHRNYC